MVTVDRSNDRPIHAKLELTGLSTDDKPVVKFNDYAIGNGSTFYEMDTKKVYMYDEQNKKWWDV